MATSQDVGVLTRKLGAADYDPGKYVAEISQRCVGGEEVLQQRKVIQAVADDTNNQLKKNVYQNYSQFIETAKEISHLESDMYRLSHMITEQRKLLTGLLETSILGDSVPLSHDIEKDEVEEVEKEPETIPVNQMDTGRKQLIDLMENVEGGRDVIDVPTRFVLSHCDLVEIDVSENTALHRVRGYICNDSVIIATWLREKRGPVRYKLDAVYPVSTIAVVNVRDLAGIKNAWKLLASPDNRLFQCTDAETKKRCLAAYEEAKELQKTGGLPRTKQFERGKSVRPKKNEPMNPFGDEEFVDSDDPEDEHENVEVAEWLVELADTLEVHIAQREFEQAVELIKEAEEEFEKLDELSFKMQEIKDTAVIRKEDLLKVLKNELKVTPDKSLQGGPRTARRAVGLLSALGQADHARDLLLSHRTALLRHTVKNVRPEGSTIVYVQRLGSAFFHQISETCKEFDKCFPGDNEKASSLLMWTEEEIDWFVDRLNKQVFNSQSGISLVASCVSSLRKQAEHLVSSGTDVMFLMDVRLQPTCEKLIMEARDKAVEAVKMRWTEDKWQPHVSSSRQILDKTIAELSNIGVANINSFTNPDSLNLQLTSNSISFTQAYLQLTDHLLQLLTPGTRHLVNESLVSVLHAHLRHMEQSVKTDKADRQLDNQFVAKNAAFILDTVITLVEHKYQEKTKTEVPKLGKLHSNYSWLKEGKLTKYADPNYV